VDCYSETNRHIEAKPAWRYDVAQQEEVREQIEKLRRRLSEDPNDSRALYELGTLYMKKMFQPEQALRFFERALQIEPGDTDAKLAYAEANMQTRTFTIETKAGQAQVAVYEVMGIRDPLTDQERLPARFLKKYAEAAKLIDLPDQLILPVEALDGTVGHSRVVGVLSYALADALGLNEAQRKNVLVAGYVQDIGKKLVPHEILTRTDMLSEKEFAEIRRHATEATPVLKMAGFDPAIVEIVENHHERHNGDGYPNGKSGEQIPLGARITAVADTYDAMVAWRPFRGPKSRSEALEELKRETRAGLYDAAIVNTLAKLLEDD
jgi:putative nucleotidyltransferase with HDIG domain